MTTDRAAEILDYYKGCRECVVPDCKCSECDEAIDMAIKAIKQTDPEPRVLTIDELKALPRLAIVWTEYWNGEEKKADPKLFAAMKCYDGTLVDEDASVYNDFEKDMTPDRFDGSCWRFWLGKPTEEQRKAVPWN